MEVLKAPVADHADRQADGRVAAGDRREAAVWAPGRGLPGRRFHRVLPSGVTGTRAWALAGLSIARSDTPIPQVRNAPAGMISMTHASDRRPGGTREPSSSSIDRARGDPAGCTTAVPWKLMVAGGNGRHQRQDPAPAHWNSHGDPAVGCHVPGLPAAGCDRDEQPLAAGLVHHAAGPGFPARGDVTEHGERRPGDRPPYLLTGQPGLGCLSWSWIVLVAMTAPPAENAAIWPATIDASTRYHLAPESPGPHRRDLRP